MGVTTLRWIVVLVALLASLRPSFSQDRRLARVQPPGPTSDKRLALVIGNNAYSDAPLRNAVNDARAMHAALGDLGFASTLVLDANLDAMERAINGFVSRISPGDVALFYFAGHGIEIEGENYLIPVAFSAADEVQVKRRALPAGEVLERLVAKGARVQITVLDACRNNPYRFTRSASRGLAPMAPVAAGSLVAFATAPGQTASDNAQGQNGLFTAYLVEALKQPGNLLAGDVFRAVRRAVYEKSGGKQWPFVSENLLTDFAFRGTAVPSPALPAPRPAPAAAAPSPRPPSGAVPPRSGGSTPPSIAGEFSSKTFPGDAGTVQSIAFSGTSRTVATGHASGVVKIWDVQSGRLVSSIGELEGPVWALAISPDGRQIAARRGDSTVSIRDAETGAEAHRLVGHSGYVNAVAWTPDGRSLVTASEDTTVRVWDVQSQSERHTLTHHSAPVTSVAIAPVAGVGVSGSRDQNVCVFDLKSGDLRFSLPAGGPVWSVAVDRNRSRIAAGTDAGTILIWNANGEPVATIDAHRGQVWALAMGADGHIVSAGADGSVRIWTSAGAAVRTLDGPGGWLRALALSPDGGWVATGGGAGSLRLWKRPGS